MFQHLVHRLAHNPSRPNPSCLYCAIRRRLNCAAKYGLANLGKGD